MSIDFILMKKYLLVASLPFFILEHPGVTSFAVSRCAFRSDKTNVEISKRMLLMIRSPSIHSVVTSTVTRHMSFDNDDFMASLSGDLAQASSSNIDPRMEQDPGNKSTQSRMFQRLMQAKQDGIPGMPPAPRRSPVDQQQQSNIATRSVESSADPTTKPAHTMQRQPDKIANTSDLYLETLKIDTATRQRARQRGDEEEANAVFQDPRIDQLKDSLQPYFEQSSAQHTAASQDLATTANDEEMKLLYAHLLKKKEEDDKKEENRNDPSNTMVSYREMMKQKMLSKNTSFNKQSSNQRENILDANMVSPPTTQQDQQIAAIRTDLSPKKQQETNNVAVEDDSNARAKIRTLMAFLLKHRGGTNFGSGRLKRPEEIAKYENVLNEVMDILKRETTSENNVAVSPLLKKDEEDITLNSNKEIDSSLACVEAVIAAYKRTPSTSMLLSLKEALLHAAQTCSAFKTVEVPQTPGPISTPPITEPVDEAAMTTLPEKETNVEVKNNIIEENIENRRVLEKAFLAMEKIAGDDKYGIKTGLSSQEAADAADTLEAMRRVLMEELNCA